ncbi:MAG TPA: helix-turn-helix domain-containing protein [Gemmatimonadaceae bacterium]|nr:helix-turn-helix domain-containing protein [Gemmatimonadaceae bacterium]
MTVRGNLTVTFPAESVDEIVEHVTARVLAQLDSRSPWMTRKEAAAYLRLPISRLEKDRAIPSHRDGGRVLYNRRELDDYFLSLGPCGA